MCPVLGQTRKLCFGELAGGEQFSLLCKSVTVSEVFSFEADI
jgi:hypothetical protein